MFKKGGLLRTIWNCIVAAAFIAFGIATCINSGNQDFQNVIILIAGIIVIVDAGFRLITQVINIFSVGETTVVKTDWSSAVVGASGLTIGILLILVSRGESTALTTLLEYLTKFIGILLIVAGSIAILYAIIFIVRRVLSVFQNILMMVAGAIAITGGILVLVFSTNEALLQVFFVLFGILFILTGLLVLFLAILLAIGASKKAKVEKEALKEEAAAEEGDVVAEEAEPVEEPSEEEKPEESEEPKPEEEKPEEKPEEPKNPEDKPE